MLSQARPDTANLSVARVRVTACIARNLNPARWAFRRRESSLSCYLQFIRRMKWSMTGLAQGQDNTGMALSGNHHQLMLNAIRGEHLAQSLELALQWLGFISRM